MCLLSECSLHMALPSRILAGIWDSVGFWTKLILPWNDLIPTCVPRNWRNSVEVRGFRKMRPGRNRNTTRNAHPSPSLSSPVPPSGNDRQRYRDGSPQLFSGQNRPVAAAATGKHRHDASTTRRAFTWLINSKNNNIFDFKQQQHVTNHVG